LQDNILTIVVFSDENAKIVLDFVGEKTIEDIQSNTLRLVNITDPDKIYLRIVKYEGKGFVPTDHTYFMKELFKPLAKGNSYSY